MRQALEEARDKGASSAPSKLHASDEARAYYGVLDEHVEDPELLADVALKLEEIIDCHNVRDWQHKPDVHNKIFNDVDDYFHHLKQEHGVFVPWGELDAAIGKVINVAKARDARN